MIERNGPELAGPSKRGAAFWWVSGLVPYGSPTAPPSVRAEIPPPAGENAGVRDDAHMTTEELELIPEGETKFFGLQTSIFGLPQRL